MQLILAHYIKHYFGYNKLHRKNIEIYFGLWPLHVTRSFCIDIIKGTGPFIQI